MKFNGFFCLLILVTVIKLEFVCSALSNQLQEFHQAISSAKEDLQNLRSKINVNDENLRQRRRTIEQLLGNFQKNAKFADEVENDNWENKQQLAGDECKSGGAKDSCGGADGETGKKHTSSLDNLESVCSRGGGANKCGESKPSNDKVKKRLHLANRAFGRHKGLRSKSKYKALKSLVPQDDYDDYDEDLGYNINPLQSDNPAETMYMNNDYIYENDNDVNDAGEEQQIYNKNKRRDHDYDYDYDVQYPDPHSRSYRDVASAANAAQNDQNNQAKNDLSHEANYKLSKIEQDAAEKKKLNSKWGWKNSRLRKRSVRFNPMNEIKLKTSHRLMRKGFGPSLPSYSLVDTRRELLLDDMVKKLERNMRPMPRAVEFDKTFETFPQGDGTNRYQYMPRAKRLDEALDKTAERSNNAVKGGKGYNRRRHVKSKRKGSGKGKLTSKKSQTAKLKTKTRKNAKSKRFPKNAPDEPKTSPEKYHNQLKRTTAENNGIASKNTDEKQPIREDVAKVADKKNKDDDTDKLKSESIEIDKKNQVRRRVKRIGEVGLDGFVAIREVPVSVAASSAAGNGEGLERIKRAANETEQNNNSDKPKRRRRRRAIDIEHDIIVNKDFDTVETNEDEMRRRVIRSPKSLTLNGTSNGALLHKDANISIPLAINVTEHKIFKRSSNFRDDNDDNNSDMRDMLYGTANMGLENEDGIALASEEGNSMERARRISAKDIDFGIAVKDFPNEQFDNLKSKEPEMAKFDGMKFDNLWYENENNMTRNSKKKSHKENPKLYQTRKSEGKTRKFSAMNKKMLTDKIIKKSGNLHTKYNHNKMTDMCIVKDNNKNNIAGKIMDNDNKKVDKKMQDFDNKKVDNKMKCNIKENDNGNSNGISGTIKENNAGGNNQTNNDEVKTSQGGSQNLGGIPEKVGNATSCDQKEIDRNTILALREQILNCTSVANLESFLRKISGKQQLSSDNNNNGNNNNQKDGNNFNNGNGNQDNSVPTSTPESIDICVITNNTDTSQTNNTTSMSNIKGSNTSTESNSKSKEPSQDSNSSNGNSPESDKSNESNNTSTDEGTNHRNNLMKLNITINASVMGDKKANNFYGNGTIKVQPGYGEDRERREIFFGEIQRYGRKNDEGQNCDNHESENQKEKENQKVEEKPKEVEIVPGKLSSEIVKSIFDRVRNNPKMDVLWQSLSQKSIPVKERNPNFYPLRSPDNEMDIRHAEEMLEMTMETINNMIEQQVRSRTCIPLPPDLSNFYELILKTHAEQAKTRERRSSTLSLTTDFSAEVRAIDGNKLDEESRIVKKLLKQYEELPQEDQQQVSAIRDDLLMDLFYLRKLKERHENFERRKRQANFEENNKLSSSDSELIKKLESGYTPQFLKLLKTSELFSEAASARQDNYQQ